MSRFDTVLITGANRGIGLEFTRYYAAHSKKVIACCRNPDQASELQTLKQTHKVIDIYSLDVCKQKEIDSLHHELKDQVIDLVINNAGIYGPKGSETSLDTAMWSKVFEVNVMAPISIARKFTKQLSHSSFPVIANISSKMGSIEDNQSGGATIYRSSKAALNAATKSFALDNIEAGITTVLLHPGWVKTDMGGPNGLIDTKTSVNGMGKVLESVTKHNNAGFFNYDGTLLPW